MGELRLGTFTRLFAEVEREAQMKTRRVLTGIALAVERQAKINASVGAHARRTKTPASPGTGPAVISGTLRRSITHSPITFAGGGWETKVGTGVGFTPPYGRTPANKYGFYLETGLKNGSTYPFLKPAADFGMRVVAPQLYQTAFRGNWPHF